MIRYGLLLAVAIAEEGGARTPRKSELDMVSGKLLSALTGCQEEGGSVAGECGVCCLDELGGRGGSLDAEVVSRVRPAEICNKGCNTPRMPNEGMGGREGNG